MPEAGSKAAPGGRLAAERVIGKPPGSAAVIEKVSGLPAITATSEGAFRMGAVSGWTDRGLETVVLPNCTERVGDCCCESASALTTKESSVSRGRVVIEAGTFRFELVLETVSRATAGTFVALICTMHTAVFPAWTLPGHTRDVGRIPVMGNASVLLPPFNAAVILTCWS